MDEMTDFDMLLAEYTDRKHPRVHGVICKCVDRYGKEIYSKISGYSSLGPDAEPLRPDAVLKLASATKLITSIALLQCVDDGLIALDDPLTHILPELDCKEILTDVEDSEFTLEPSKTAITARHLLSHTSGLGYPFMNKLLGLRANVRAQQGIVRSFRVTERYNTPLVFEPGTGWLYGSSMDWAGVVVSRLHGVSLGDYMVEHVWKKVGLAAPFPTFNIAKHEEYNARIMHGAALTSEGLLEHCDAWAFDNNEDEDGGAGLSATTQDFVAVLADLISESPRLLKKATVVKMFSPQLAPGSTSVQMLLNLRPAWDIVAGPIADDLANHGLGGMLCMGVVPEIGQRGGMLAWGGASNIVWWMNRDEGVAGFFATQQSPFGNPTVTKLVNAWKKDFWSGYKPMET
ncbi:hypothetical protein NX059_004356 [Plenodomus lindquistii]|nr:hypothetical protein NX059_004356 [Plenodomus lindquistii]